MPYYLMQKYFNQCGMRDNMRLHTSNVKMTSANDLPHEKLQFQIKYEMSHIKALYKHGLCGRTFTQHSNNGKYVKFDI